MTKNSLFTVLMRFGIGGLIVVATVRAGLVAAPAQDQSPSSNPWRAAVMQHHFVAVARVHEAVIRGDLRGTLPPAAELAAMRTPVNLPIDAEPFVAALRDAARRAGTAPSLGTAAAETVTMLQQCASCHRAAGIYPAPVAVKRPDVGGIVGHMLDHIRAADDLLQGLIVPSDALWQSGAERLRTAALRPRDWVPDPKLTAEVRKTDAAVHALADRARAATTTKERGAMYADLLTTCASCHSLHRGVWGPRSYR